ncbi:MAG: aminotransferase class I/II-fold pyridoxal phosphate-dependent enzyme [Bacteroidetes bacterium]|nr:MAG: aminotransferase class I/II-fold pyridoxal phosphate-dependent enzyme [Bacteroidota bacterium]
MIWKKLSKEEIRKRVFEALNQNVDFSQGYFLGVPASKLDDKVFYDDAPFLENAPFMKTLVANPNHIGCHTYGESEAFFKGTQQIEKELIRICAEDILKGDENAQDGYVASGGTEANIQALWMYRNYFIQEHGASLHEIGVLCSEDTHYSVYKGCDLLQLDAAPVSVNDNREIDEISVEKALKKLEKNGKKYFIVLCNMATTMFGSVDNPDIYTNVLRQKQHPFYIHVDGAYGGFIYPFTTQNEKLTFKNPHIVSFTLDAHKLAQAPYGTGIFVARKGWMNYTTTQKASYVQGYDSTLIGSRSGANAVAVWMILSTYGPFLWQEKIEKLMYRTSWVEEKLRELGIEYYRHPNLNIITIKASYLSDSVVQKYHLVPDRHTNPEWYKIVVMEHVDLDVLHQFYEDLKLSVKEKNTLKKRNSF